MTGDVTKRVFGDALALHGKEREAFLLHACGGNETRLDTVRGLLADHRELGDRFEPPPHAVGLRQRLHALFAACKGAGDARSIELPDFTGTRFGGHYEIGEKLGEGTFGAVYAARAPSQRHDLAVKVCRSFGDETNGWARRERQALRRLNCPGVVRLLDAGRHDHWDFLVMRRIHGRAFPARDLPAAWTAIEMPLVRLLETLCRIHAAGIVHGDLKPSNVLVGEHGQVTVLDLGVAAGPAIAGRIPDSAGLGTLRYAAPEMIGPEAAAPSVATDLYAVGVMAYQALTGAVPHEDGPPETFRARRGSDPIDPSPHDLAGLSDEVATLLTGLLQSDPVERPPTAVDALAALSGELPPSEWGSEGLSSASAPLDQAELGAFLCGHDRLFHLREDAARELYLRTGGDPSEVLAELGSWVRAGLAVPEHGRVRVSRDALDHLGLGFPTRVAVVGRPLAAPPGEDAARLLDLLRVSGRAVTPDVLARALGVGASRLEALVGEVEEGGCVRRMPDGTLQVVVDVLPRNPEAARAATRRAHEALAGALEPGDEERLTHLIGAGTGGIAAEALLVGRRLYGMGEVGRALGLVSEALAAVRVEGADGADEATLLGLLLEIAVAEGTDRGIELALYEFDRSSVEASSLRNVERLARAALLVERGEGAFGLGLTEVIGRLDDPALELRRLSIRVLAVRRGARARAEDVLADAEGWAMTRPEPRVQRELIEWLGWRRYAEGAYADAAELHLRAVHVSQNDMARLLGLLNAASASLEACALDRAERLAQQALPLARAARHPFHECRAEWILRSVTYRSGAAADVDAELVAAIEQLDAHAMAALVLLNEAAVAWRLEDVPLARSLAQRASVEFTAAESGWGARLSDALAVAAADDGDSETIRETFRLATHCPLTATGVQIAGLLGPSLADIPAAWLAAVHTLAGRIPPATWRFRRNVLSIDEALARIS